MNDTIFKFPLQLVDMQEVELPPEARLLHAGVDPNGRLCLWAEVNRDHAHSKGEKRFFAIVGTGGSLPSGCRHVGTAVVGALVCHVYEFSTTKGFR